MPLFAAPEVPLFIPSSTPSPTPPEDLCRRADASVLAQRRLAPLKSRLKAQAPAQTEAGNKPPGPTTHGLTGTHDGDEVISDEDESDADEPDAAAAAPAAAAAHAAPDNDGNNDGDVESDEDESEDDGANDGDEKEEEEEEEASASVETEIVLPRLPYVPEEKEIASQSVMAQRRIAPIRSRRVGASQLQAPTTGLNAAATSAQAPAPASETMQNEAAEQPS